MEICAVAPHGFIEQSHRQPPIGECGLARQRFERGVCTAPRRVEVAAIKRNQRARRFEVRFINRKSMRLERVPGESNLGVDRKTRHEVPSSGNCGESWLVACEDFCGSSVPFASATRPETGAD
jgi:hypothetical protein